MRYENEIIEEVRERNDIVDVISGYVSLKKKGSSYFGLCPFHNEKSPSFSVSREKQMYYCFGCGQGGDVYHFLQEYNRLSFGEALKELADRAFACLVALEEPYREVFTLCVFGNLSLKDISAMFGKSESWARVTYYRAKQKIINELE